MSAELLVIILVALIVFGPNKLPMLARDLARFFHYVRLWKQKAAAFWQSQIQEQQLLENRQKAAKADRLYEDE